MRILALLAAVLIPVRIFAVPEGPRRDATFASHVPNVRDFGARGDGVADDTDAIQAAIDYVKPGAAVVNSAAYGSRTGRVFVPLGHYRVRHPLRLYSGVWLDGSGQGSTIEATSDFPSREAILKSSTEGLSPQGYGGCAVTNLHLKARGGSGIWAFSHSEMKSVGTLRAENLWIETPKGLDLTPYTQNSSVRNVLFTGEIDQMLRVKGNFNTFEQLDKEGATGSGDEPYIQVEGHTAGASSSNHFRQILIEQVTSPRKSLIVARGADELVLEDLWLEPTRTNGYALVLEHCRDFQIRGHFAHVGSWGKVAIRDRSWGAIETLNSDAEDVPWEEIFQIDSTSFLRSGTAFTRRSTNALPLDRSTRFEHGVVVDRMLTTAPRPGVSPISRPRDLRLQNLLANPSFEAGSYGWRLPAGFAVVEFPPAEVGPGKMLHVAGGRGAAPIAQEIDVPVSWVGHSLTLSFAGRVEGKGFLAPYVVGAGIDLGQSSFHIGAGSGWALASVTFQPSAAGKLVVGAWFAGGEPSSHAYMDEARLAFGVEGFPGGGQFQQIELGGVSITTGRAPPTSGAWKPGDLVLNAGASVGRPLGWRAVEDEGGTRWEAISLPSRATMVVEGGVVGPSGCRDFVLGMRGAEPGSVCAPGIAPGPPPDCIISCAVSRPDQAVMRVCNVGREARSLGRVRLSVEVAGF